MKVLLLDGYNLMYRARHSMSRGYEGSQTTVYAFFRSLRPIIEKFAPDRVYFVLEGYPKTRMQICPDYKGNRVYHDRDGFRAQRREITDILKHQFPIDVIRHKNFECDDVLANLIRYEHPTDECIVVSSDSDFLQLYNSHTDVHVYNPVRKKFMPRPEFDYVKWKALRGDASDNILGFKGIGNKRATTMVNDISRLDEFLDKGPGNREYFERNISMIQFHDMKNDLEGADRWSQRVSWDKIRGRFEGLKFFSITNDKSWQKYVETFKCLE